MSSEYDQERVYDRIEYARKRMEKQVRADEIKGELCDYVRSMRPESVKKKLDLLASMEDQKDLYQYVKKLELINTSIYCMNCEHVKVVPGFNDVSSSATTSNNGLSAADIVKREQLVTTVGNLERKMTQLQSTIQEASDNIETMKSFYNNLKKDLDDCKETLVTDTSTHTRDQKINNLLSTLNSRVELERRMDRKLNDMSMDNFLNMEGL